MKLLRLPFGYRIVKEKRGREGLRACGGYTMEEWLEELEDDRALAQLAERLVPLIYSQLLRRQARNSRTVRSAAIR